MLLSNINKVYIILHKKKKVYIIIINILRHYAGDKES